MPREVAAMTHRYPTRTFAAGALVAALAAAVALWAWSQRSGESSERGLLDGSLSLAEAAEFDDFALVSLGTAYNDHPLVLVQDEAYAGLIDRETGRLEKPGTRIVTFAYDRDCEERPCGYPIVVQVSPACTVPPALIADEAKDGPDQELTQSGVKAQRFGDGHVRIWTGDITVAVWDESVPGRLSPGEVLAQLQGVNDLGRALAARWPAPEEHSFDCPPGVVPEPRTSG